MISQSVDVSSNIVRMHGSDTNQPDIVEWLLVADHCLMGNTRQAHPRQTMPTRASLGQVLGASSRARVVRLRPIERPMSVLFIDQAVAGPRAFGLHPELATAISMPSRPALSTTRRTSGSATRCPSSGKTVTTVLPLANASTTSITGDVCGATSNCSPLTDTCPQSTCVTLCEFPSIRTVVIACTAITAPFLLGKS